VKHKLRIKGPAGAIETVIEEPAGEPRGLALVAHPHPLRGGSLDNKVAWTLARAALPVWSGGDPPQFPRRGESEGEFDHGVGETEDLLAVARAAEAHYGTLPWTLMGFSFGAYVQQRVAKSAPCRAPDHGGSGGVHVRVRTHPNAQHHHPRRPG
jgi:alpha/beta superfamily hydrolase